MAQRIAQLERIFYGSEGGTEGTDPTAPTLGTATEAILVEDLKLSPEIQHHLRQFRGKMGRFKGVMGEVGGGLSFSCELRNRGGTNNVCDIDPLLTCVLGGRLPSGTSADSGSTTIASATNGTNFVLTSGTNFADGQAVFVDMTGSGGYEGTIIDSNSSGTIVAKQALSATPTAGRNVKSGVTYYSADTGHTSLSFQIWLDADTYISFVGCKGNAKIAVGAPGMIPKISFDFQAIAWSINTSSNGRPAMTLGDSGSPPVALSSSFKLDGTKTGILSYELDLGSQLARKKSQNSTYGTSSIVVANRTPSGKLRIYNSDDTRWSDRAAGTERGFCHQLNAGLNTMVLLCTPKAQLSDIGRGDENGLTTDDLGFRPDITAGEDDIFVAMG